MERALPPYATALGRSPTRRASCFFRFEYEHAPEAEDEGVGLGVEHGFEVGDERLGTRARAEFIHDETHERGLGFAHERREFSRDPLARDVVDGGGVVDGPIERVGEDVGARRGNGRHERGDVNLRRRSVAAIRVVGVGVEDGRTVGGGERGG